MGNYDFGRRRSSRQLSDLSNDLSSDDTRRAVRAGDCLDWVFISSTLLRRLQS
jgi:hypothetical protein